MQSESIVRVRGADELEVHTLCPAERWVVGQPGQDALSRSLIGWKLYLAEDADVRAGDRVTVRGADFSVLGQPALWLGGGVVVEVGDIWTATVSLRHPGGTRTFNSDTRRTDYTAATPYAEGQLARLQPEFSRAVQQGQEQAEETLQVTGYVVTLSADSTIDAELAPGDLVDVTASPDPVLNGRTLKVTDILRGAVQSERNLLCTLTVPAEVVS